MAMDIDLERAKRALVHFGSAMEEAQRVVRPGPSGIVRFRGEDRVMEVPVTWAAAGLVAFAIATIISQMPSRRREREEETLGIG